MESYCNFDCHLTAQLTDYLSHNTNFFILKWYIWKESFGFCLPYFGYPLALLFLKPHSLCFLLKYLKVDSDWILQMSANITMQGTKDDHRTWPPHWTFRSRKHQAWQIPRVLCPVYRDHYELKINTCEHSSYSRHSKAINSTVAPQAPIWQCLI